MLDAVSRLVEYTFENSQFFQATLYLRNTKKIEFLQMVTYNLYYSFKFEDTMDIIFFIYDISNADNASMCWFLLRLFCLLSFYHGLKKNNLM